MNSKKEAAISFLQLAASGKVDEAFDRYVDSKNFRHHNPYFSGDAASLASAMAKNAIDNPNKSFEVLRALEDGDLVAVHSRVRLKLSGSDLAVVHILRFEGDHIAELWDIGQAVPPNSPNSNGMF